MANVPLQSLLEQARDALETGTPEEAIGIAQHVLHHAPQTMEGHRLLGEAYLNTNQPQQAMAAFEHVLRADPESVAAYYGLGLAQQALDERAAAIHSFERALEIQPNLNELRTQLLRLYAETPGSAAQFRLSRSGLGRLYMRGQMYEQAIDEFRAVLGNDPDRNDVRVALAEALWRDGQEEDAAEWCRQTLKQEADLHKPTVILGYLQLAAGQPEGQELWQRAVLQDPELSMARTLFDVLPPLEIEASRIPPFDREAWQAAVQARSVVQAEPAQVVVDNDDDFFGDSWLNGGGAPEASTDFFAASNPAMAPADATSTAPSSDATSMDDEDLLASLLGFSDESFGEQPASVDMSAANPPQDPHDLDLPDQRPQVKHADTIAFGSQEMTATPLEGDVQPFTVDDFPMMDGDIRPFSLDDEPDTLSAPGQTRGDLEELGTVQPFSLENLAELDQASAPDRDAFASVSQTPRESSAGQTGDEGIPRQVDPPAQAGAQIFPSLSESQEVAPQAPSTTGLTPNELDTEPFFSLDDGDRSGTDETSSGRTHAAAIYSGSPAVNPAETSASSGAEVEDPQAAPQADQMGFLDDDVAQFTPFTLADLGLTEEEIAALDTANEQQSAEDAMTPSPVPDAASSDTVPPRGGETADTLSFSLADLGLSDADLEGLDQALPGADEAPPTQGPRTGVDAAEGRGESTDVDSSFPGDQNAGDEDQFSQWMHSELPSNDTASTDAPESELTPFSLADLGLSEEELTQLEQDQDQPSGEAVAPAELPFSLADLGLSEEELQLLDQDQDLTPSAAGSDEAADFSLADLGLTEDDARVPDVGPGMTLPGTSDGDEDTGSFSLADLGLTEDEIADFDLGVSPLPAPSAIDQATNTSSAADLAATPHGSDEDEATPQVLPPAVDEEDMPSATEQAPSQVAMDATAMAADQGAPAPAVQSGLESFVAQLQTNPENHVLRLAVARMSEQTNDLEQAMVHYRHLIRRNALADQVVDDLMLMIESQSDTPLLQRLHRLLGDAYMKQGRLSDAMQEYSWTPDRS